LGRTPGKESLLVPSDLVFRQLQEHLDDSPEGFPATQSGADVRILKRLFTPEDAQVAIQLSALKPLPVSTIRRRLKKNGLDLTYSHLRQTLAGMVQKGTILAIWEGYREVHYQNAGVSAGGIYDFQVNRLSPDLISDFDEYHMESIAKPIKKGARRLLPLRTIPVEKSIPRSTEKYIASYENVRQLILDAPGPIAVANCICRQTKDIKGQSCQHTSLRESCLQIGLDHARQYVDMGIARYIAKEEAYEILGKAQQDGLILQPENSQNPEAICCCCGDCCAELTAVSRYPQPAKLYSTNYYIDVVTQLCNHCGECLKRCQLNARLIAEGKPAVDLDRCIGCGNCVVTCPTGATRLMKKEVLEVPPKNKNEMYLQMLSAKTEKIKVLESRKNRSTSVDF
jgi:electron transport complex protein RnfB